MMDVLRRALKKIEDYRVPMEGAVTVSEIRIDSKRSFYTIKSKTGNVMNNVPGPAGIPADAGVAIGFQDGGNGQHYSPFIINRVPSKDSPLVKKKATKFKNQKPVSGTVYVGFGSGQIGRLNPSTGVLTLVWLNEDNPPSSPTVRSIDVSEDAVWVLDAGHRASKYTLELSLVTRRDFVVEFDPRMPQEGAPSSIVFDGVNLIGTSGFIVYDPAAPPAQDYLARFYYQYYEPTGLADAGLTVHEIWPGLVMEDGDGSLAADVNDAFKITTDVAANDVFNSARYSSVTQGWILDIRDGVNATSINDPDLWPQTRINDGNGDFVHHGRGQVTTAGSLILKLPDSPPWSVARIGFTYNEIIERNSVTILSSFDVSNPSWAGGWPPQIALSLDGTKLYELYWGDEDNPVATVVTRNYPGLEVVSSVEITGFAWDMMPAVPVAL